jgi:hypothetical protein
MKMDDLIRLAKAIRARNAVEEEITAIIGRPAQLGHVGEYIAAHVFGIALEHSATHKGSDGRFTCGPLAGRTVNVKWYAKMEGLLDLAVDAIPDYYLVLAGPKSAAVSSRGTTRPWVIASAFLFHVGELVDHLHTRGVKLGVATSVTRPIWDKAEIYPLAANPRLTLSDEQRSLLSLFR